MARFGLPGLRQAPLTYPERLQTFQGFWDDNEATARQLAAIGHVYDRPPLEALEEGSRCIECSHFVRRERSISGLEERLGSQTNIQGHFGFEGFHFHVPGCLYLQTRIPVDYKDVEELRGEWGRHRQPRWLLRPSNSRPPREDRPQSTRTSSLFSLPTELRLQIYGLVLPQLDAVTEIVRLHQASPRLVTQNASQKPCRRNPNKTNVLRTCKAVHDEVLDMLFTNHTYRFCDPKTLYLFLRHIGARGRALLKSVETWCGSREDAITFSLLATCPKLRCLTLTLPHPILLPPRARPWRLDGVAALLELRGLEEVKFAGECDGKGVERFLNDDSGDAAIVRRSVMRARGEQGGVRWVDEYMDL